jgi:hypothetical protein
MLDSFDGSAASAPFGWGATGRRVFWAARRRKTTIVFGPAGRRAPSGEEARKARV